jgi:uncharacterized membrane protein (UPF0127 family)
MLTDAAKTAWARKREILVVFACFVFVLVLVLAIDKQEKQYLKLGSEKFNYETVVTPQAQQQGLSDRASLPADHAMLFVFPQAGQNCFWMKNMHFSLDMIWLNDQKQAVYIKENASPENYPEQFCPDTPGRYVIEVNAGMVKKAGLKLGDQVQF